MHAGTIEALRSKSESIRENWERQLRGEKVSTPLADPNTLVYYIPDALDRVFEHLEESRRVDKPAVVLARPPCSCGHNPFLAFYVAGEQVMMEALVLLQAELGRGPRAARDAAVLQAVFRRLAVNEIEGFCGVCTHHYSAECTSYPVRS
jgi:hypothetical protein